MGLRSFEVTMSRHSHTANGVGVRSCQTLTLSKLCVYVYVYGLVARTAAAAHCGHTPLKYTHVYNMRVIRTRNVNQIHVHVHVRARTYYLLSDKPADQPPKMADVSINFDDFAILFILNAETSSIKPGTPSEVCVHRPF